MEAVQRDRWQKTAERSRGNSLAPAARSSLAVEWAGCDLKRLIALPDRESARLHVAGWPDEDGKAVHQCADTAMD